MASTPLKLAVVGAGPSAFYVASRLLSLIPKGHPRHDLLRIHMYDRSWAPHGLVRYGVAPDHPEVKNCIHKFDEAAKDPRFRYFGHVAISQNFNSGRSVSPESTNVPIASLAQHYSHLLIATGCPNPVLHPALPPSQMVMPAIDIVHWYTHHPSVVSPPPLHRTRHVTIVGMGNVSLDIARILLTPPEQLEKYDIPQDAIKRLQSSVVEHVSIVGRRGPLEAAFTTKELREMMNLTDASMVPLDEAILKVPDGKTISRQQSRVLELLRRGSKNKPGTQRKTWSLDFYRSPTSAQIPESYTHEPLSLTLAHTSVDPESGKAVISAETSVLKTDLVVTSLGFKPETDALYPLAKHRQNLRVVQGRVIAPNSSEDIPFKNVYASGWAATGAKGVLASTMMDAYAVADTILSDWLPSDAVVENTPAPAPTSSEPATTEPTPPHEESQSKKGITRALPLLTPATPKTLDTFPEALHPHLRTGTVIGYDDWKLVDAREIEKGQALGKERERMNWIEANWTVLQAQRRAS